MHRWTTLLCLVLHHARASLAQPARIALSVLHATDARPAPRPPASINTVLALVPAPLHAQVAPIATALAATPPPVQPEAIVVAGILLAVLVAAAVLLGLMQLTRHYHCHRCRAGPAEQARLLAGADPRWSGGWDSEEPQEECAPPPPYRAPPPYRTALAESASKDVPSLRAPQIEAGSGSLNRLRCVLVLLEPAPTPRVSSESLLSSRPPLNFRPFAAAVPIVHAPIPRLPPARDAASPVPLPLTGKFNDSSCTGTR
ncbi:hypothetical protein B0H15DRAFT_1024608 [Mycena belliarum]|uniref:Uncharacterized protein n=1 Tax=Mycena belliarum TaxID=1033014 RepID=A0AAD6U0L9_9AGAR|nr:hypothetical protein B0H15DRAFT_1024608 [Mycena belliae]